MKRKRILFWTDANDHWNAVGTCLQKSGKNGKVMKMDVCINSISTDNESLKTDGNKPLI